MIDWFETSEDDRKLIIQQVSVKLGFPPSAIEKDWWATIALRTIFETKYAEYFVFKGGTSLSKAWQIIERFSEDIDLALDRSSLGFKGDLTRKDVTRLRKASCQFIDQEFKQVLSDTLIGKGVKDFNLSILEFERSDTDPLSIILEYKSLTENIEYLQPRILIEISARALRDPLENRNIISYIGNEFHGRSFADNLISIPTVLPSRTLLEKMFLLHEEFQKPKEREIRSYRMSRHLYDISRLMDTEFLNQAILDKSLYNSIIRHREMLTKISWIDYETLKPKFLNFIPPESVIDKYRTDYRNMQESMFYGKTESFDVLINRLKELNTRINNI